MAEAVARRQLWIDRAVCAAAGLCALVAAGALLLLVGAIVLRGLPALDLHFLHGAMREAGGAGGIFFHLVGTTILVTTAAVVATPPALGLAFTHGFWLRSQGARRLVEQLLYLWNGMPSILLGILGYIVFVHGLGWGKSWLAGGLLLGWVILPTLAVALLERVRAIPRAAIEAATGLGLRPAQVLLSVVVPRSLAGLLTGLLLGLARAAGETAPILFTATVFSGATWPTGVVDSPVLALPYHVFVLAQDSLAPSTLARVWSTALVLLGVVLVLNLLALPLRLHLHEEARDG